MFTSTKAAVFHHIFIKELFLGIPFNGNEHDNREVTMQLIGLIKRRFLKGETYRQFPNVNPLGTSHSILLLKRAPSYRAHKCATTTLYGLI